MRRSRPRPRSPSARRPRPVRLVRLAAALCAALLLAVPGTAWAEERILSYRVGRPGSTGRQSRRRRDDPGQRRRQPDQSRHLSRFPDPLQNRHRAGACGSASRFSRSSMTERPATYAVETLGNGMRVRIGDAAHLHSPWRAQLHDPLSDDPPARLFRGFDELYWNATGNRLDIPDRRRGSADHPPSGRGFGQRELLHRPEGIEGAERRSGLRATGPHRLPDDRAARCRRKG